jgi:hypothetical protein
MTRRDDLAAFFSLLLASFVCCGGLGIARLGFYHDDWHLLAAMHVAPGGWMSGMQALVNLAPAIVFRPMEIPVFSGLYGLFGLNPLPWQVALLAINLGCAWMLRSVLRRFGASPAPALIAALLALAYPAKDSTMFWSTTVVISLSLLMFLIAFDRHLGHVHKTGKSNLFVVAGCLLACFTLYDQCLLLFPLFFLAPAHSKEERRRRLHGMLLAGAILAAVILYQFVFVPFALGVIHNKTVQLSLSHWLDVYYAGFAALAGSELIRSTAALFWNALRSAPLLAVCALAAAAVALRPAARSQSADTRRLFALAAGFYILGYLPIAFSDYYPTPLNHFNRINLVPAYGAAVAVCALLEYLRRRTAHAAGALLASFLLISHAGAASAWAESYRRQLALRDAILSQIDNWPRDSVLFLHLKEDFVAGKAPVFLAHYDSTAAVRLWTGDNERRADMLRPQTRFLSDGVDNNGRKVPYNRARVLDEMDGRLMKLALRRSPYF